MHLRMYVHIYQPPSLKKQTKYSKKRKRKKKRRKKGTLPSRSPAPGGKDLMCCKKAIGCVFLGGGGGEVNDGRSLGGLRLGKGGFLLDEDGGRWDWWDGGDDCIHR